MIISERHPTVKQDKAIEQGRPTVFTADEAAVGDATSDAKAIRAKWKFYVVPVTAKTSAYALYEPKTDVECKARSYTIDPDTCAVVSVAAERSNRLYFPT